MKYIAIISILILSFLKGNAQELYCTVRVESPQNQTTDPRIFRSMESAIAEFINSHKWATDDIFLDQERISCNLIINISDNPSDGVYGGSFLIQSERPVFNSAYHSTLFSYNDKDISFEYIEFQNLDYNENGYTSNLTSLIAYYAYIILGIDYESMELGAGTPFFKKAEAVVNNIPSNEKNKYKGWSAFDGTRNRFILTDNLLNMRFKDFKEAVYTYHRLGLDNLYTDASMGRIAITNALKLLERIAEDNPSSMLLKIFFLAKSDELMNLFAGTSSQERGFIIPLLSKLDPVNAEKYAALYK